MRIGYIRCSTIEQNEARQVKMMEAQQAERLFIDKASGKNTNRAAFQEMMDYVRAGDVVITESISRIARNTRDLLSIISDLTARQVEFISLKESIDTTTPQTVLDKFHTGGYTKNSPSRDGNPLRGRAYLVDSRPQSLGYKKSNRLGWDLGRLLLFAIINLNQQAANTNDNKGIREQIAVCHHLGSPLSVRSGGKKLPPRRGTRLPLLAAPRRQYHTSTKSARPGLCRLCPNWTHDRSGKRISFRRAQLQRHGIKRPRHK